MATACQKALATACKKKERVQNNTQPILATMAEFPTRMADFSRSGVVTKMFARPPSVAPQNWATRGKLRVDCSTLRKKPALSLSGVALYRRRVGVEKAQSPG